MKDKNFFMKQTSNPSGLFGKLLTSIWSIHFNSLSDWTVRSTPIAKGSKILEVGYGGGSTIKNLLKHNDDIHVYGIDLSQESLQQSSKVNKDAIANNRVHLEIGDVSKMSYADNSFDGIFAIQSHIYWDDLEKGIDECYRVLKPGGVLVISCEVKMIKRYLPEYSDSFEFNKIFVRKGYSIVKSNKDETHIIYWCQK